MTIRNHQNRQIAQQPIKQCDRESGPKVYVRCLLLYFCLCSLMIIAIVLNIVVTAKLLLAYWTYSHLGSSPKEDKSTSSQWPGRASFPEVKTFTELERFVISRDTRVTTDAKSIVHDLDLLARTRQYEWIIQQQEKEEQQRKAIKYLLAALQPEPRQQPQRDELLMEHSDLWNFFFGYGSIINIFPARREFNIFSPHTTIEEDMIADWRNMDRDLSIDAFPQFPQTETQHPVVPQK